MSARANDDVKLTYSQGKVTGVSGTLTLSATATAMQSGQPASAAVTYAVRLASVDLVRATMTMETVYQLPDGTTQTARFRLPFRADHAASIGSPPMFTPDDPMTSCGCFE